MSEDLYKRLEFLEKENEDLRKRLESRESYIRQAMGSYVSAEIADEILSREDMLAVAGERRKVTMLFSDIRKSTELSEAMDAVGYIRLLNHYLREMIRIINSWQGNILEFVGDAIVAVYGAPKQNDEAAQDAIYSAVGMQRRMEAVNRWNAEQGYPSISMGIGIHTGEAIVGTIGSAVRMKYDVIGRNVNLASRIEGFTQGGQILVSSPTLDEAGDGVVERGEGSAWVSPKGIHEKVLVHDVIGINSLRIPQWWSA